METLTCRGFWGNSPPESFKILKLGNATLLEIGGWGVGGGKAPPAPPSLLGSLKGLGHAILGNFSIDQMVIELTEITK